MTERRRKFLFGAAILTILLGMLASALLFLAFLEEEQCTLLADKPLYDQAIKLNNIASENYQALGKFLGYLKYEPGEVLGRKDPTKLYMPLRLEAIEYDHLELATEKQRLLTLSADCANIRLSFLNSSEPPTVGRENQTITSVQAALVELPELDEAEETAGKEEVACYLERLADIKFASNQHYGCYEPRAYPCVLVDSMGRSRQIATLNVDYIAFEIDGDPETHKRGQYSKQLNYCPRAQ